MNLHARWVGVLFGTGILALAIAAATKAWSYQVQPGVSLVRGELTRHFESHYDEVFPAKTFGTNLWAAIQFLLFGEGRSGVVVGENGWLYTQEEFCDHTDADVKIDARLHLIERVRDEMQQRDTQLVVALLPAKTRMYPEHLGDRQPAALHRDLYPRMQSELRRLQIAAPDLLGALARCKNEVSVFLRTDTHWTPEGAACAAVAIASTTGVDGRQRFDTEVDAPRTHRGDLLQFLPLTPYFAALLPPPDLLVPRVTVTASPTDLFGDAPAPDTVLIGTSYSADVKWNFDGALRDALDTDVLNLAEPGKGPFAPMLAYLELPVARTSPKRVIWEIPERYLPAGESLQDPDRLQIAQIGP